MANPDTTPTSVLRDLFGRLDYGKLAPAITLVVLFVVSAFASPFFLQYQNLLNILRQVSYTGIIALGMTFVIIGGGIDLSVGSLVAFSGGIAIIAMNNVANPVLGVIVALAVSLAIGLGGGILNGYIIAKWKIASFIATLAMMSVYRSLALFIANAGEFRSMNRLFPSVGSGRFLTVPVPVWVFFGLAAVFHLVLNHTRYGRYVCAVGSNERVAVYSAIKTDLITWGTYALTGLTVGVSAVLISSRLNSIGSFNGGNAYELDAIAAVVIGGTAMSGGKGSVWGTVLGAITLGIINNMLNMLRISPLLQGTVKGLVIIAAVLLQYRKSK